MSMEDADNKFIQLLKGIILNDIHITVTSEEAFRKFRQKQLNAIEMYCGIWCDSNGYEKVPFDELPFDAKCKSLLYARESMGKDNSWRR